MLPDSWPLSSTPPPTSDERGSLTMTTTNTSGDGGPFPAAPGRVHRHDHLAPRALLPGMQRVQRIQSSTAPTPSSRSERAHRGAEEAEEAGGNLRRSPKALLPRDDRELNRQLLDEARNNVDLRHVDAALGVRHLVAAEA